MVRTYSERLEIVFWDYMIPLMRGESLVSRLVQAFLPTVLALARRRALIWRIVILLAWAWAGLVLGLILGVLRARLG